MILPVGFGKKLPSFPFLTMSVLIVISIISVYYFGVFEGFEPEHNSVRNAFTTSQLEFSKKNCLLQVKSKSACGMAQEFLVSPKDFKFTKMNSLPASDQIQMSNWIVALREPLKARNFAVQDLVPAFADYRQNEMQLSARQGLLTPLSLTTKATLVSFATHSGWLHLIGNLLVLFFFMRLLEPRYSRVVILFVFVISGTLGLLIEVLMRKDELVAILGASAGVSGVIGLFWATFFHHSVRAIFLNPMTWFNRQKLYIPVSWGVPLFLISLDLIGLFETSNVAHGAHLYGFAIGASFGVACRFLFPLARDFLYEEELVKMYQLKTNTNAPVEARLKLCEEVLAYNPNQFRALRIGIKISNSQHSFFREHLQEYLVMSLKNRKIQDLTLTLPALAWDFNYRDVLRDVGPESLLGLGKAGLEIGDWHSSLYFYSLYAERFASKKNAELVHKTLLGILKHGLADPTAARNLQQWLKSQQNVNFLVKIRQELPLLTSLGESA